MSSINISEKQSATSRRHWNLSHICLGRHKREEAGGTFFRGFPVARFILQFHICDGGLRLQLMILLFWTWKRAFHMLADSGLTKYSCHNSWDQIRLMMWLRSRVLGQAYLAARQAAALAAALAAQPPVQQQAPAPMPQIPLPIRTRLGGG